ncbi:splicing factor 45-like [Physella acuta]|uniref:splicing factor 45-like n=1 Tax=Physella acuta TaxID=109671 RepID=UPI0027DB4B49|nr:splicing factor 45-like [Physella acuta]XP_059167701.1 splicing factor 45-like [Physella acuta]XP_059167702.1 splicing factor 45-like [Physella acuta]
MSLYDDLDIKEDAGSGKITKSSVVSGWSPGYKLLQSTLQAKKATTLQPKRNRTSHLAPVVDLKKHVDPDSPMQFNMQTGKLERVNPPPIQPQASIAVAPITPSSTSPFIQMEPTPSITGVADEYDPFRPNEYDEVVKRMKEDKEKEREKDRRREDRRDRQERERDRREERERERERRRQERRMEEEEETEFEKMRKRRAAEDEEEEIDRSKRAGAAIAPPTALLEEPPVNPDLIERPKSPNMGMAMMGSVASKIMAKYGYKEGQGLGKSEQGMSTALYVEKTSKRGGKIIHEKDIPKEPPPSNTNLMKNPSKVILLQNMVGPGEVDEELEPETAEECTKYGKVNKCVIFEIPENPEEESVRIFVEFERMESAIKALVDLNGRFFGGRVVKACFYNLDKFRRMDYNGPVD